MVKSKSENNDTTKKPESIRLFADDGGFLEFIGWLTGGICGAVKSVFIFIISLVIIIALIKLFLPFI